MATDNDMSKEDWQRKDKLNSRMSAIKAVGMSYEGTGKNSQFLRNEADNIYEWIVQDQIWAEPEPKELVITPQPTPDQQKALDIVFKETGLGKEAVFNFSKEWYPNGKYPDISSVSKWIQAIKERKNAQ